MNKNSKKHKIGILTFQRAHNYGAILQCYALQEVLKAIGFDVQIIDYYPQSMRYYYYFAWDRFVPWHPRTLIMNIVYFTRRVKRYKTFNDFIEKHLNLSPCTVLDTLSSYYDIVIIGSDQVWNPKNSLGKYDNYYWGNFKSGVHPKIISYAASMGKAWEFVDWIKVCSLLNNFNAISVREKYLADLLAEKCHKQATIVLDPTLLQERSFWLNQSKEIEIKKPYLFFYQARTNKLAYKYAKMQAKLMNLDLICLSADIMSNNSRVSINANPLDFLNLIRNASYVLTTSFHGTVFCCQFHKEFSTIRLDDGDDGRVFSLLNLLGIENRIISLNNTPSHDIIDWIEVDKRIKKLRAFSLNWLLDNL